MSDARYEKYLNEIRSCWDWDALYAACADDLEDGDEDGTAYFGNVLHVTPSGKVYTPWANSNVDGCPNCNGEGKVPNPRYRKKQHERLQRIRTRLWKNGCKNLSKICERERKAAPRHTCTVCGGLGSKEAHNDELWYTALETVAAEHGMFVTGSEGDGCDILVGRSIPDTDRDVVSQSDTPEETDDA